MLLGYGICQNWDPKSAVVGLLVCPKPIWKSTLTRDDCSPGWQSWLASLIQSWCSAFTHHMWWCVFWHMRDPWSELLRIRCWRRSRWIWKNFSRNTMCVPNASRPIAAARHSQTNSLPRSGWGGKNTGWLVTWDCPLRTDSASWKSLESLIQLIFILQFLNLASEFQDSISIFDQFSPRNCVGCWALKSLQFFHLTETFLMSSTKVPRLCANNCWWRSWWSRRSCSSPWRAR